MKIILVLLMLFGLNVQAKPVNINTADAKTIAKSLNGIGIKRAQSIIAYRNKNGNFKTLDDLTNIKDIGKKTVQRNSKDILFN